MKWYSKKETAKILGVSIQTLDRLMANGTITYYKTSPYKSAKVRFLEEDVNKFLKSMKIN